MFENDNDRQQIVYKNTSIIIALEAMEAFQKGEATKEEIEKYDIPDIEMYINKLDKYIRKDAERALRILKNMIGIPVE